MRSKYNYKVVINATLIFYMIPANLIALANYLAGEFDNREQANAEPAWYVHLRFWQIPVSIFTEDSLTLFAEQASVVNLDVPYRQRILRLQSSDAASLQVQYYMPKDPSSISGAGLNRTLLNGLTADDLDLLPGCKLLVTEQQLASNRYHFRASPVADSTCSFRYNNQTINVSLGFEATEGEFLSYDKGIDPTTSSATWGAIMGPYRYTKRVQL